MDVYFGILWASLLILANTLSVTTAYSEFDNYVYFIAGGRGGAERDIEFYHPSIENLTCSISPPSLEDSGTYWPWHTTFYYGQTIHLCGGHYAPYNCISHSKNKTGWTKHTVSPPRFRGHTSVVLKSTLYLIGGIYHTNNWFWHGAASTPLPLTSHPILKDVPNIDYKGAYPCSAMIDEDNLVITGGSYNNQKLSTVIQYSTKSSNATALLSLMKPREDHGCVVAEVENNKWLIVTGGAGDKSTTEMLQLGASSWVSLGNLNVGRQAHSMVADKSVMVIGGVSGTESLNSVETLDFVKKVWKVTYPSLKTARFHFGGAVKIPASMFDCSGATKSTSIATLASTASSCSPITLCPTCPEKNCPTAPASPTEDSCFDVGCKNAFKGLGMCVDTSTVDWEIVSKIIDFSAGTKHEKCSKDCNCKCFKHTGCYSQQCDENLGICLIPEEEEKRGFFIPTEYKKAFPCDESLDCFCYIKNYEGVTKPLDAVTKLNTNSSCKANKKCAKNKGECFGKGDTIPKNAKKKGWCNKKAGCKCFVV